MSATVQTDRSANAQNTAKDQRSKYPVSKLINIEIKLAVCEAYVCNFLFIIFAQCSLQVATQETF